MDFLHIQYKNNNDIKIKIELLIIKEQQKILK